MKRVLVYVISANIHPWRQMIDTALETWDLDYEEDVPTAYYCGNPPHENPAIKSYPIDENYKTMGQKDILAYRDSLEWPWDYMARVNASCYVHKRRLLDHVQTLPEKGVFRGVVLGPTITCGTNRAWMWGGGQFIISRDVMEAMVANSHRWRHDVMEDVAMSELVQECGFSLDSQGRFCSVNRVPGGWSCITYGSPIGGFEFSDFAEGISRLEDQFFFRVKDDADRNVDAQVMRLLKQYLP